MEKTPFRRLRTARSRTRGLADGHDTAVNFALVRLGAAGRNRNPGRFGRKIEMYVGGERRKRKKGSEEGRKEGRKESESERRREGRCSSRPRDLSTVGNCPGSRAFQPRVAGYAKEQATSGDLKCPANPFHPSHCRTKLPSPVLSLSLSLFPGETFSSPSSRFSSSRLIRFRR